jgi:hypothetical protein
MTASSPRQKVPTWRVLVRTLRVFLLGLVILVGLPLLAWWTVGLVLRYQGRQELRGVLVELDQKDPAWTWEGLHANRPSVPAEQNLLEMLKRLARQVRPKDRIPTPWRSQRQAWAEYRLSVPPNHRWIPEATTVVRDDLQAFPEALPLLRSLKNYPHGSVEIILEPNPLQTRLEFMDSWVTVRDMLELDTLLAIQEGDFRRAAGHIQTLFQTSRVIGETSCLLSHLTSRSIHRMGIEKVEQWLAHDSAPEQLEQVQRWIEEGLPHLTSDWPWRVERAMVNELFVQLERGQVSLDELFGRDIPDGDWYLYQWLRWSYWYRVPRDRAYYLRYFTRWIEEVMRRPVEERLAAAQAFEESLKSDLPTSEAPVAHLMLKYTTTRRLVVGLIQSVALSRCAVVGVACERFRQKHQRWPKELSELTPEFLPHLPVDPFTGQPLQMTRTAEGIVIHCTVQPQEGLRRPEHPREAVGLPEGVLIGFRLWNPERRRQPPLPAQVPADEQ